MIKVLFTTQIAWTLDNRTTEIRCLEVFLKITSTFLLSWVSVYTDKDQRLAAMSTGLMLNNRPKVDAVVWSGPKKNSMIKQSLSDVSWDDLDS